MPVIKICYNFSSSLFPNYHSLQRCLLFKHFNHHISLKHLTYSFQHSIPYYHPLVPIPFQWSRCQRLDSLIPHEPWCTYTSSKLIDIYLEFGKEWSDDYWMSCKGNNFHNILHTLLSIFIAQGLNALDSPIHIILLLHTANTTCRIQNVFVSTTKTHILWGTCIICSLHVRYGPIHKSFYHATCRCLSFYHL